MILPSTLDSSFDSAPVTASHAVVAQREGGSPLDSRRWSLDLLLRSLLKYQELMHDLSYTKQPQ
jgi:hypothetical protein